MYVAFVELDVFSGLSAFYPYASTSAPTYPLPPPTTLVGALAYPYMRQNHVEDEGEYSATVKLLNHVVYATAGSEGYVITRDVERVYQAIYQRKDRWKELHKDLWYTVAVRGIVRYLDDKLCVVYLSKSRDLLNYAYGIVRIGRKENHVVVRSVVVKEINEIPVEARHGKLFETLFYTPVSIAECEDVTSIRINMNKLTQINYTHTTKPDIEEFYVPRGLGPMKCKLLDGGVLLELQGFHVAIPGYILKQ